MWWSNFTNVISVASFNINFPIPLSCNWFFDIRKTSFTISCLLISLAGNFLFTHLLYLLCERQTRPPDLVRSYVNSQFGRRAWASPSSKLLPIDSHGSRKKSLNPKWQRRECHQDGCESLNTLTTPRSCFRWIIICGTGKLQVRES